MKGLERRLALVPLAISLYGCPQPDDSAIDTSDTHIPDTDTDTDADSDTDSDSDTDADTDTDENHAPVINTTSLPSAITQTAYNATIQATDADSDTLTYSLTTAPSWLSINSSTGTLTGTPTTRGTSSLEVKVSDGYLDATKTYSLTINPIATVSMYVIDADDGAGVTTSCNVDVVLTNTSSGYTETARASGASSIAAFSLDQIGTYDISVASTNTGSNCYGGFEHAEWDNFIAGSNSSWVTLIPETYQNEVVSVVGSQLDMATKGYPAGNVDTVRDLFIYMLQSNYRIPDSYGWNDSIRDGTTPLTVDTIDWTYSGIQYNDGLELAISYWNGHLAPTVQQVSSGGDIWFTRGSNWQADPNSEDDSQGVWTVTDVEIEYTAAIGENTIENAGAFFTHEMGHSYFNHTNVTGFIMHQALGTVIEPHELELLTARNFTNVGNATPRGYSLQLDGFSE